MDILKYFNLVCYLMGLCLGAVAFTSVTVIPPVIYSFFLSSLQCSKCILKPLFLFSFFTLLNETGRLKGDAEGKSHLPTAGIGSELYSDEVLLYGQV